MEVTEGVQDVAALGYWIAAAAGDIVASMAQVPAANPGVVTFPGDCHNCCQAADLGPEEYKGEVAE